jgi:hypothetical protein
MMRKRYELEVMCGAKINIEIVYGEQNTPNEDANEKPDEDDPLYSTGHSMYGASWYQETKPKTTKDYYQKSQGKLWQESGFATGNAALPDVPVMPQSYRDSIFPEGFEAGSHQLTTISPIPSLQMHTSPKPTQTLAGDDMFSLLFGNPSVEPVQTSNDDFFGKKYENMFAAGLVTNRENMFRKEENNMFSAARSNSPPKRDYDSSIDSSKRSMFLPGQRDLFAESYSLKPPSPPPHRFFEEWDVPLNPSASNHP